MSIQQKRAKNALKAPVRKAVRAKPKQGLSFDQALELTLKMHGDAIKALAYR